MIANQLHREHRNLDSLYNTATLYCEPDAVISWVNPKRASFTFTFTDSSKLRIERGSCGALIWAGVEQ